MEILWAVIQHFHQISQTKPHAHMHIHFQPKKSFQIENIWEITDHKQCDLVFAPKTSTNPTGRDTNSVKKSAFQCRCRQRRWQEAFEKRIGNRTTKWSQVHLCHRSKRPTDRTEHRTTVRLINRSTKHRSTSNRHWNSTANASQPKFRHISISFGSFHFRFQHIQF